MLALKMCSRLTSQSCRDSRGKFPINGLASSHGHRRSKYINIDMNMKNRSIQRLLAVAKAVWKYFVLPAFIGIFVVVMVLFTGIGELAFPSRITIYNDTGEELRNVKIFGQAGSSAPTDLAPGKSTSKEYVLAGVSDMGVQFTPPDGQPVDGYFFVAGVGLSREIKVTIGPTLEISRQEK